jgi:hypothetical protein
LEPLVKNGELQSAIKAAGEAALRLHADNERLRAVLWNVRPYVYGIDRIKMIDAVLGEATTVTVGAATDE